MRKIARRTWRYFEAFVTAEQNFLPPGQLSRKRRSRYSRSVPRRRISASISGRSCRRAPSAGSVSRRRSRASSRRSPRSTACRNIAAISSNWIARGGSNQWSRGYVSSVDSGNLAGHLIAVSPCCREWPKPHPPTPGQSRRHRPTVAAILKEVLSELPRRPQDRTAAEAPDRGAHRRLPERLAAVKREREFASIRVINLAVLARDMHKLTVNLDHEGAHRPQRRSGDMGGFAGGRLRGPYRRRRLRPRCHRGSAPASAGAQGARTRHRLLHGLQLPVPAGAAAAVDRLRVNANELDEACYDLLASEARLTSLFAIAKGDLPTEHWYKLGRPIVPIGARVRSSPGRVRCSNI